MRRWPGVVLACALVVLTASCRDAGPARDGPQVVPPEGVQPGVDPLPDTLRQQIEGEPSPAALPAPDVHVTLSEWRVLLSRDEVAAGPTVFLIANAGTLAHALVIEGAGERWEVDLLNPAQAVTLNVDLRPGEYRVYCPQVVDGTAHAGLGMATRLRVR
jgi:hypothetical protein